MQHDYKKNEINSAINAGDYYCFHWFAVGIVIPILTLFLLEKGLNLIQVGISFATYSAATVFLELPTGSLGKFRGSLPGSLL